MHAPSRRGLGQRAALALLPLLLAAACSASSGDAPALPAPATGPAAPSRPSGGPAVGFAGATPTVAGHEAATTALARIVGGLPAGCRGRLERSDAHLVSVAWRCGTQVAAATVTLAGRPVALGDILHGGYQAYLSSAAAQQFKVEGIDHADTTDLGTWYLTPDALAVAFPDGVVSYPLPSLEEYLAAPSSL